MRARALQGGRLILARFGDDLLNGIHRKKQMPRIVFERLEAKPLITSPCRIVYRVNLDRANADYSRCNNDLSQRVR